MYFKFDSDMFSLAAPDSLSFKITWLDKNQNSTWSLKYYNLSGLQTALTVTGTGDNQWKTSNVTIHNPVINQNGILGSDFLLVNTDSMDDVFHGVEVDISRTSSSTAIHTISDSPKTIIFPNPTSSIFYWDEEIVLDEIIVYNRKGQIVSGASKPKNHSFSLLNLEKGAYHIVGLKEKKIVLTEKVLKD
jgi:hypothetical protein